MVTQVTESADTELDTEVSSQWTETEEEADTAQGLLPAEMLIEGEYPLYETRSLVWLRMGLPVFVAVFGIVITYIADSIPLGFVHDISDLIPLALVRSIIGWIGISLIITGFSGILIRWLRWKLTTYTATNLRIINRTGIIGKSCADTSLSKIQTIYLQIPLLGRILNYGTIRMVTAAGGSTAVLWPGIKEPKIVHQKLNEITEQYRRQAA
ncbi:MAG: PH domain-containing protein [Dehalococcoidales bacterium]|nr:MAG: PH domain-containing protein [Dehalococcoidales bacterium]